MSTALSMRCLDSDFVFLWCYLCYRLIALAEWRRTALKKSCLSICASSFVARDSKLFLRLFEEGSGEPRS